MHRCSTVVVKRTKIRMDKLIFSYEVIAVLAMVASVSEACDFIDTLKDKASNEPRWIVVIDAGSTKTNINLYKLQLIKDQTTWLPICHVNQKWETSIFKYDPDKISEVREMRTQMKNILEFAKHSIPASQHKKTPVFLYITAHLRKIPIEKSEELLQISRAIIQESAFDKYVPENGMPRVKFISGIEEALYAWLSINYFLNIKTQTSFQESGVLQIGGGSTQIAFRPSAMLLSKVGIEKSTLWYPLPKSTLEKINSGPGVYAQSFPDYGFSAVIMKYFNAFPECEIYGRCTSGKIYESICVHPDYKGEFTFGPYTIQVKGRPEKSQRRFRDCADIARQILTDRAFLKKEIKNLLMVEKHPSFFAVDCYYWVAHEIVTQTGLRNKKTKVDSICSQGYKMKLGDLFTGAKRLCERVIRQSSNPHLPYACIRATYTTVLFKEFYGFSYDTVFYFCRKLGVKTMDKKIRKIRAKWTVGVAGYAAETIMKKSL